MAELGFLGQRVKDYGASTVGQAMASSEMKELQTQYDQKLQEQIKLIVKNEEEERKANSCAPPSGGCCPAHQTVICNGTRDFWWRVRMAVSLTLGVVVAALPSLFSYAGWNTGPIDVPSWLDGYPAVIAIFVCGYNLGETMEYNFQAVIGCVGAQVADPCASTNPITADVSASKILIECFWV